MHYLAIGKDHCFGQRHHTMEALHEAVKNFQKNTPDKESFLEEWANGAVVCLHHGPFEKTWFSRVGAVIHITAGGLYVE